MRCRPQLACTQRPFTVHAVQSASSTVQSASTQLNTCYAAHLTTCFWHLSKHTRRKVRGPLQDHRQTQITVYTIATDLKCSLRVGFEQGCYGSRMLSHPEVLRL